MLHCDHLIDGLFPAAPPTQSVVNHVFMATFVNDRKPNRIANICTHFVKYVIISVNEREKEKEHLRSSRRAYLFGTLHIDHPVIKMQNIFIYDVSVHLYEINNEVSLRLFQYNNLH